MRDRLVSDYSDYHPKPNPNPHPDPDPDPYPHPVPFKTRWMTLAEKKRNKLALIDYWMQALKALVEAKLGGREFSGFEAVDMAQVGFKGKGDTGEVFIYVKVT